MSNSIPIGAAIPDVTSKFDQILVGIDFSEQSAIAREHALRLARRTGASVTLAHAWKMPGLMAIVKDMEEEQIDGGPKERKALLESHLQKLADESQQGGVEVTTRTVDEYPDSGLAHAASELGMDLVVLGTHGRTGVQRFLLGSVAERTVRESETDVLIARGEPPAVDGYSKLLVPTDFSDAAEVALRRAISLARPGALVELVHSREEPALLPTGTDPAAGAVAARELVKTAIRDAERKAQPLLEKYGGDDVKISFEQSALSPAGEIVQRAEEGQHEIVVLGSHGRRGWRRFILGSVAEKTVRHAPCSVYVVKTGF